ncbi:MAG: class I SAM-dependent RNA methyltransferase [Crocinitomicaceae bacterium]|nr:class I SAM-dependent RNA methyltransferase [Crocinitomicaceae bacterium]
MKYTLTIKTLFGLEPILAEELNNLGYKDHEQHIRAISLKGDLKDIYFLNLHLRTAISILVEFEKFTIKNDSELYHKLKRIPWTEIFDLDKTFSIRGAVNSKMFKHSQFPILVCKDAIVDSFKKKYDDRPNVETKSPDLVFDLHIRDHDVTVSLNSSGVPLYQRGYRTKTGVAPINEVLAAGMIQMSGWKADSDLYDIFCGSGTILIEAALLANDIPSNIIRKGYAFQKWKNYNEKMWEEIYEKANKRPKRDLNITIRGCDIDAEVIQSARNNIKKLPLGKTIDFQIKSFEDFEPESDHGVIISNPPYGKRINPDSIMEMYQGIGDKLKKSFNGYDCWFISSNLEVMKFIGLRPSRKIKLFNGSDECSFRKFEVYEGSKKAKNNPN